MIRIKGKWYAAVFAGVMGFAAGAATNMGGEHLNDALKAMGSTEGTMLLGLALTGMLLNTALFCWCSIAAGKAGRVLSFGTLWMKAVFAGMLCRALFNYLNVAKALLAALTMFGSACICVSYLMEREESQDKAKRIAIWLCGMTVEGIVIPSVARTCALLFN